MSPTNQPTGSRSPDHSYKLCRITNRKAGRTAVEPDESWCAQKMESISLLTRKKQPPPICVKGIHGSPPNIPCTAKE
jgi:hypothetical protein